MEHAVLSPSKSSMWLNCTPSARLGEKFSKGRRKSNEAADEGTLAHELSEWLLKLELKRVNGAKFHTALAKIKTNKLYSASMREHCDQFVAYVMEQFNAMKEKHGEAIIFLEVHLDLSMFIPESFGHGDVVIIGGHEMLVIDFKYGKGVYVETENNTQMMIYALGAIDCFHAVSNDITEVLMTIYQPRLDNISSWKATVKSLVKWANSTLIPKAILAFKGKGELVAGEHCLFCPVKATCKAHAEYNLELAKEEFATDLSDKELVEVFLRAKQIRSWLTSVEEYMLYEALRGKTWKGLKLVHGRSIRQLTNQNLIRKILEKKNIPKGDFLSEPELLGITALEKNIGAKTLNEWIGKYIIKPDGNPSLVHADSKGRDYSPLSSAIEDFKK